MRDKCREFASSMHVFVKRSMSKNMFSIQIFYNARNSKNAAHVVTGCPNYFKQLVIPVLKIF